MLEMCIVSGKLGKSLAIECLNFVYTTLAIPCWNEVVSGK